MIFNKNIAQQTALHLLQINAIKLNPENPFTWASGWKSPIYCDNRIALSYPRVRDFLSNVLSEKIKKDFGGSLVIAGVATGAIGIGMLVAQKLNLPFIYIRPEPKKHGKQNQIEV
jgi:orotate phosphoribosyltransferase